MTTVLPRCMKEMIPFAGRNGEEAPLAAWCDRPLGHRGPCKSQAACRRRDKKAKAYRLRRARQLSADTGPRTTAGMLERMAAEYGSRDTSAETAGGSWTALAQREARDGHDGALP